MTEAIPKALSLIFTVCGDPLAGEARFTFGEFQLIAGFNLLAVVIGVFAVLEVLIRASGPPDNDVKLAKFSGLVLPTSSEWSGRKKGLFKSVLIGNFIGILPGTGAATAAFISYAEARRSSSRRDNFGKGNLMASSRPSLPTTRRSTRGIWRRGQNMITGPH